MKTSVKNIIKGKQAKRHFVHSESLELKGNWWPATIPGCMITSGINGECAENNLEFNRLSLVMYSHDWSGIGDIYVDNKKVTSLDFFSAFGHLKEFEIGEFPLKKHDLSIVATGKKSPQSNGSELVIKGILVEPAQSVTSESPTSLKQMQDLQKGQLKRSEEQAKQGSQCDPQFREKRIEFYTDRYHEVINLIDKPAVILELGAGFADAFYPEFEKEIAASSQIQYHIVDINDDAIAYMNRIFDKYSGSEKRAQISDLTSLPHEDAKFDAVYASHVLEHTTDLPLTLKEIQRVLKPDGRLIFGVPLGWDEEPAHLWKLEPEEWMLMMKDSGFKILETKVRHFLGGTYELFAVLVKP